MISDYYEVIKKLWNQKKWKKNKQINKIARHIIRNRMWARKYVHDEETKLDKILMSPPSKRLMDALNIKVSTKKYPDPVVSFRRYDMTKHKESI